MQSGCIALSLMSAMLQQVVAESLTAEQNEESSECKLSV